MAKKTKKIAKLNSTSPKTERHTAMELLPFLFFGGYMFFTLALPPVQSFDEFHYIPAAKELIQLNLNRNFEHPPLGKYLLGASWYLLNQTTNLMGELASFRFIAVAFGLLILAAFRKWMSYFKFSPALSLAAVWTVGFNMIWFVQSKTAMLDVFYIAFGLWGLYFIATAKTKPLRGYGGWALIGFAMGSKWSALPYAVIGLWLSRAWGLRRLAIAGVVSLGLYFSLFLPMTQLKTGAINLTSLWNEQLRMLDGLKSTSTREHSYRSSWWEWPTLHRPMWYTFSKVETPPDGQAAFYSVFMGGNPLLIWLGGLAVLVMSYCALAMKRVRQDGKTLMLLTLFYLPFLIWILTPRKLMYFYYIMPSSFWYGPLIFLALREFIKNDKLYMKAIWSFVCLEGLLFFFFLPIMDGRALPYSTFLMFYQGWMHKLNWI